MATLMLDQVASIQKWEPLNLRAITVLLVLSTASVAIRIIAKLNTKARFGLDDVFIVAALLFTYVESALSLYAGHIGKGLATMMDPGYSEYSKWVIIGGIFYAPTVFCISASVLFFYRRLFPIASTKRAVTIFLIIHVLWALACFFGSVFICSPVNLAWAPLMVQAVNVDKCMKYPLFFVAILSLELGLNAAVLVMPIKQTFSLQLNLQTRLMLMFVFLLGGASLVSGIVRVQQTYRPGEPYIDFAADMFWLAIHVNTALIAASLPVYRPLMRASLGFISSSIRKYGSGGYDSKRSGGSSGNKASAGFSSKPSAGYSNIEDKQSQKSLVGSRSEEISMDPIERQIYLAEQEPKRTHITVQRTYEVDHI